MRSVVTGDLLAARQWIADARRERFDWSACPQPDGSSDLELAIGAGLVELLAQRDGIEPPSWAKEIGPHEDLVILDPGLDKMPRSFTRAKESGPEPLRKRNLIALPDFLDVA
ncbi:MAG TPA: hypothetical protein VJZ00_15260 [Thermoanaerobaculia bacterium]|nr:hypothetical protein [Thermoanaerobaculia bacterium]